MEKSNNRGILLFLYFCSTKEFENNNKNKKIFFKNLLLSFLTIIFVFFINIYSSRTIYQKNYLFDNEKRKNMFVKPLFIYYILVENFNGFNTKGIFNR